MALRQDKSEHRDPFRLGDDPLVEEELKLELFEAACADAEIPPTLRRQAGYDDVAWHAERLGR